MPLSAGVHLATGLLCVAASVVMLARASGRATRVAHAVVLGSMVALLLGMGSVYIALGSAAVLALTAAALVVHARHRAAYACAVDVAVCSGLVLLMAVPLLLAGHAATPEPGSAGLHAGVHAVVPGGADHQVLLTGVAALLLVTWSAARRRVAGELDRRWAGAAAWVMMLAMGAMVAS